MSQLENPGVFGLLSKRKFLPYFVTQAFGAFNDNLFKQGILLLFTYTLATTQTSLFNNLAAGLFILPFFLFSPLAGQIADKYEKGMLIRRIKLVEIVLMVLAGVAFVYEKNILLLVLLFFMGLQSSLFGPVKYSILPQHLNNHELLAGNALVEMGTFLAILFGTILAGILFPLPSGKLAIAIGIVICAVLGYIASRSIPRAPAANPDLKIGLNPVKEIFRIGRTAHGQRAVFLSIMAISWFWFLGASYLTQFNLYTKSYLLGDAQVATSLLTCFSVGIGLGSLICSKLSGGRVELGLVPVGSLGLTIFGAHLMFATPTLDGDSLRGFADFIADPTSYGVIIDLVMIGVFGGFYIVPLYALIQQRTDEKQRAQFIALNNVMNAIFMVGSAVAAIVMLTVLEISLPVYFLVLAIMNGVVAIYIFYQVPEFVLRFLVYLLSHTMYRVKHEGLENIPEEGPALLVCNHVSYADAPLIAGTVGRPIRFIMDRNIANMRGMGWFFKLARTIPITSQHKDPEVYEKAFREASEALRNGELVCIFPEGRLTKSGEIEPFRAGVERILENDPVPVIPMALQGLWGSFFSHANGTALAKLPKRFWSKVKLIAGAYIPPEQASAGILETRVKELRGAVQ